MILPEKFEELSNTGRLNGKSFDAFVNEGFKGSYERLNELKDKASDLNRKLDIEFVDNSKGRNFDITDDMKFVYRTKAGVERERDITKYAFRQLCTRMGIPSNYLLKCQESGKTDLIMENFKAWSDDYRGTLQIMSSGDENATRAVMTDSYKRYDYSKILTNTLSSIDLNRWCLVQSHLSEDIMVLRFVDINSPYYKDENSENYIMVTLVTSDVGRTGLHLNLSSYRRVCTNGMIVGGKEGTLYSLNHAGDEMKSSKIIPFSRAFDLGGQYGARFANAIETCRKEKLNPVEFSLWLEKAKRDMKLNKKKMESLEALLNSTYANEKNVWAITNGVTELSQEEASLDARLSMEQWAGDVVATRMA